MSESLTQEQKVDRIQAYTNEQGFLESRLAGAKDRAGKAKDSVEKAQADKDVSELSARLKAVKSSLTDLAGKAKTPAKRSEKR